MIQQIKDHNHYVQGVAWDPLGEYIATQSSDRTCRIYHISKNKKKDFVYCQFLLKKMEIEESKNQSTDNHTNNLKYKHYTMFHDENINS